MNFDYSTIVLLSVFTLGMALVIGVISFLRAKKAQDRHEDAAVAERQRHEDQAAPIDGTPGSIDPTVTDHHHPARPVRVPDPHDNAAPVAPTDGGRSWDKERGANPPTPNKPD